MAALGETTLQVSRIGLGLAALGRPGYINLGHAADLGADRDVAALRARAHDVLDAAHAAGVRYFDAARSYGRAEEFLGSWLNDRGLGRPEVSVGSKWGYTYTADWRVDADVKEVKDLSIETLRRQEAETRSHLDDALGLYQIHSATLESGVLDDARRARRAGAAPSRRALHRHLGDRPAPGRHGSRALEVGGFDAVQATLNLLEPSAGPALAAAHAAGLGVIVKEAVANGRLTERGDVPALIEAARELGASPDALALAFVLAQPWVEVVLSGASTASMLRSNLGALDVDVPADVLERLGALAEPAEAYWETRAQLAWN